MSLKFEIEVERKYGFKYEKEGCMSQQENLIRQTLPHRQYIYVLYVLK